MLELCYGPSLPAAYSVITTLRFYDFEIFYQKMCTLFKKNAILCLFLRNVLPSKRVVCFILNNSLLPMVEGIAFCALHKSRVLIIHYKAGDSCLFIEFSDEIYKKAPGIVIQF